MPSGPIALSPSGNRLAMIEGDDLAIVDLTHPGSRRRGRPSRTALAFVDEAHVAAVSSGLRWFEETGLVPKFGDVTTSLGVMPTDDRAGVPVR